MLLSLLPWNFLLSHISFQSFASLQPFSCLALWSSFIHSLCNLSQPGFYLCFMGRIFLVVIHAQYSPQCQPCLCRSGLPVTRMITPFQGCFFLSDTAFSFASHILCIFLLWSPYSQLEYAGISLLFFFPLEDFIHPCMLNCFFHVKSFSSIPHFFELQVILLSDFPATATWIDTSHTLICG